jgi:hypothetical protein
MLLIIQEGLYLFIHAIDYSHRIVFNYVLNAMIAIVVQSNDRDHLGKD